MLKFRFFIEQYLEEAARTMAGSGIRGERHAKNYVIPGHSLTVNTKHKDIALGDEVHVLGHHTDDKGKIHARVMHNGTEKTIPISKLNKPTSKKDVQYNDEHATAAVWNHAATKKIHGDVDKMHAEIAKAKSDPTHPLSFENASNEGFKGKEKTEEARKDYYQKLHKAAYSVQAMHDSANSNMKRHIKIGSKMYIHGAEHGHLSELYKKHYGKDYHPGAATAKTDLRVGEKDDKSAGFISLKDESGGQIASGGHQEFGAIHDAGARAMLDNHPAYRHLSPSEKEAHHKKIMHHVKKIQDIMHKGYNPDNEEDYKSKVNELRQHNEELHKKYPHLWHETRHEAVSGAQKFEKQEDGTDSPHVATDIVQHAKINKKNKVLRPATSTRLSDIDHGNKPKGFFGKSKNPTRRKDGTVAFTHRISGAAPAAARGDK